MLSRRQTLKSLAALSASLALPACQAQERQQQQAETSQTRSLASAAQTFHPFDFDKRTVKLNNGIDMPIIGIGVWTLNPSEVSPAEIAARTISSMVFCPSSKVLWVCRFCVIKCCSPVVAKS